MIARLLICPNLNLIKEEIKKSLDLHLPEIKLNHPDVLYFKAGEKLGIAQARQIKGHFLLKPYSLKGRVVILEDVSGITAEAQNALLKTLEELPKEALLIMGAASDSNLLPTVLSRCEIINLQDKSNGTLKPHNKYITDLEKLLGSSLGDRFAYIEKLKEKEEFLGTMVYFFRQQMLQSANGTKLNIFLKKLLQAEKWAKQNVNIRAILEYLMLEMPEPK